MKIENNLWMDYKNALEFLNIFNNPSITLIILFYFTEQLIVRKVKIKLQV